MIRQLTVITICKCPINLVTNPNIWYNEKNDDQLSKLSTIYAATST
jgi:hypothetical protein